MPCLDNAAQNHPVGMLREGPSLLLSPALCTRRPVCLPTHLPLWLPVCLFWQRRLGCNRRGARLSEQLAVWVNSSRLGWDGAPVCCFWDETNRKAIKKKMLQQSKMPKWCLPNVVAQLGRLEGTDTDNTWYGVFYLSMDTEKYNCELQNKQINCKLHVTTLSYRGELIEKAETLSFERGFVLRISFLMHKSKQSFLALCCHLVVNHRHYRGCITLSQLAPKLWVVTPPHRFQGWEKRFKENYSQILISSHLIFQLILIWDHLTNQSATMNFSLVTHETHDGSESVKASDVCCL